MKPKLKKTLIIVSIIILIIIGFILFLLFRPDSVIVFPTKNLNWGCSSDLWNCDDFQSQAKAQEVFENCGGIENDIHGLDKDGNGVACEGLV